jgi:SOS response regulatory protein OraA/RecX
MWRPSGDVSAKAFNGREPFMSNQQASEEAIVESVYAFAAKELKNGASVQQIESRLMENGFDQESAASVVAMLQSDELPPEKQAEQALHALVAEEMQSGASPQKLQSMLAEKGLDQDSASAVVADVSRNRAEARRAAGKRNMTHGALWCIGGIVVTGVTYIVAASSGGGTYFIAWGAIVFGALQFLRGFVQSDKG